MSKFLRPLLVLSAITLATPVRAQFTQLTDRVPSSANTLVLIDINKLNNSPLGQKENWAQRQEVAFQAGQILAPPGTEKFASAAQLDFDTMKPEWQVTLLDLNYEPKMPEVALRYQGTTDTIEGREAAVLPGDVYAVKFAGNTVAVGYPARRQEVSRWIKAIYSNSTGIRTGYLKEALQVAGLGTPVIMAMDLSGFVSAANVRARLETSETLKGRDADLDALAKVLSSIRGVALAVTVDGDRRIGAIKVDFSEDIGPLKDYAKPLLLEALGNRGVLISEFYTWDATFGDKQFQITGVLEPSGMRRILSLVEPPPSLQTYGRDRQKPTTEEEQKQLTVLASKQYLTQIDSLVDDLREHKGERKTMGQISVWFGTYARRIDHLSMVNVDPDALQYGKFVADSLRDGQASVTGAAASSRERQSQVAPQYDVYSYSTPIGVTSNWRGTTAYGWGGWAAVPNDVRRGQMQSQIRTQERLKGNSSANLVLQNIDEASADIRRTLTQKYNSDF